MGNNLHKLGSWAYSHAWHVVAGWLIVVALLGLAAAHFMKPTTSSISIPGTEAQKALDRVSELFPDAGKGSGRVVFATHNGTTIPESNDKITSVISELSKLDDVSRVVSPFENTAAISSDKTIAYAQVQLKNEAGSVPEDTITKIESILAAARSDNLQIEAGGDVISKVPAEILGIGEVGGVVLALVVLVMTLGSLVAAGMPIVTALVAIGVSMAGLFSLSEVIEIGATTPVLAVMLGLAVGIDYSLFIISKYRSYVLRGFSYQDAAARAIGTAGNAVLFAAATVVIALSALTIVQIPFMATMGLSGAATIAIAALVSITLIPALLGLAGSRIFSRKQQKVVAATQKKGPQTVESIDRKTFWYRWGAAITKHPIVILVTSVVVLAVIALPVSQLKLGLPTDQYAATDTSERKAYDLLSKGFGEGFNGPLLVVVEGLPAVGEADKAAIRDPALKQFNEQAAAAMSQQETVFQQKTATLTTPEQYAAFQQEVASAQAEGEKQKAQALGKIDQSVQQFAKLVQLNKVAEKIAERDDVKQVVPAMATDDGTKGIIQIISKTAPSSDKTVDLISYLRSSDNQKQLGGDAVTLAVTGSTALQNDINSNLSAALPLYLAVVVGLSLLLLIVAFRSILVPIKATLGFLLSVLAMFGAMVAIFQWGWFGIADAPGPIVSFIPIIAIGILFGLAMDYEFFLVSSMHESYQHTKDAKRSVIDGFGLGSKVVTAAGVIMVAVFAGFVFNHDVTIQAIGFGLAIGIFIDAFIVRMTIVPAIMTLLGKSAWWLPKWLDAIVPHVSIEGESDEPANSSKKTPVQ